jgi:hypothetical protein
MVFLKTAGRFEMKKISLLEKYNMVYAGNKGMARKGHLGGLSLNK